MGKFGLGGWSIFRSMKMCDKKNNDTKKLANGWKKVSLECKQARLGKLSQPQEDFMAMFNQFIGK